MSALSSSFVSVKNPQTHLLSVDRCLSPRNFFVSPTYQGKAKPLSYRRPFTVKASGDGRRPSSASVFVGGFILGGIAVGTLGCIYAPQISKALTGEERKELMRKLPKFIYDEEKALERTRKILSEKIAQLNSAIDDVSAQIHGGNIPNGAAVNPDELQASM